VRVIELNDRTRVHGFWFCGGPGVDWLAVILKQGDGAWEAIYRFRFHKDDKHFDSDDERSWYKIAPRADGNPALCGDKAPAILVLSMEHVARNIAAKMGSDLEYVHVDGDGAAAAAALSKTTFAQMREEHTDPRKQKYDA
jgi:hypothetical protein